MMGLKGDGVDVVVISGDVLGLHTKQGPGKEYVIWKECGKRLGKKNAKKRADEYAEMISGSIDDVYRKTGEFVNPDYVVAILYRESSHDECIVGRKEMSHVSGKGMKRSWGKADYVKQLREWSTVFSRANKACKKKGRSVDLGCLDRQMAKTHPHFTGVYAWDLGAAQFRWPGAQTRKRSVTLPGGRPIERVSVTDLLDAEVSIHMLVEDLALYRRSCKRHKHKVRTKKFKKGRDLTPEEAYFVHHHTGMNAWSDDYWKRVNKHLVDIRDNRDSLLLANLLTAKF
jgi:hypothetical protein